MGRAPLMLTVGLTGGVASGKSMAAAEFEVLGVPVLDADRVAREVVAPGGAALGRIRERFGAEFILPDGALDRRRMREHVFAQPEARHALEQITHPAIRDRLLGWRDAQRAPYCVLDIAILIEARFDTLVDRVLVIDTPPELQVQRLVARDAIAESLARQMLAAQATREQRLAHANDVVLNSGSVDALRAAIRQVHAFYLRLSESGEKRASGLHLP